MTISVLRKIPLTVTSIFIAAVFLYPRCFLLAATPFAVSGDEILFFSRALRMLHGQVLYRDFFELVGPGTDSLYAFGFFLFGQHAWVIQAWHIALGCAFCYVLTSIAKQILQGPAVLLPMLLFLVFPFNGEADATHHWYSTLAALSAVSVLIKGRQPHRIALAGLLCAVAVLFTQTQGLLAAIAFGIYLLLTPSEAPQTANSAKKLIFFLAPMLLLLSAVFGYYAVRAGAHRLFYDLVVFPFTALSGPTNRPGIYLRQFPAIHSPADLIRAVPFLFIFCLTPYAYVATLYQLWRKQEIISETRRRHLLLVCMVGLALFVAVCSGPTIFRLCTVSAPATLCFVWLIEQLPNARVIRGIVFLVALSFFLWLPVHRQIQWHRTLRLPTGETAFADPERWRMMQWLQVRTHPGDFFFNDDSINLYLALRNPTPAEFVNNGASTTAEDVSRVLAALQKDPPRFVAIYPQTLEIRDDHAGPFRDYVHSNYCLAQTFEFGQGKFVEEFWSNCSCK
jgi:hypothetical protein